MTTVTIRQTAQHTIVPDLPGTFRLVLGSLLNVTVSVGDIVDPVLDRMEAGTLSHTEARAWAAKLEREASVIRSHVGLANIIAKGE